MADYQYDLVIVGRGYAASTYLFMADLAWCQKILIIGGPDAWASVVRGDGVVNHATYIYARDPKDGGSGEQEASDRSGLKDANADILKAAIDRLGKTRKAQAEGFIGVENLYGVVSKIERSEIVLTEDIDRGPNVTVDGKTQPAFRATKGSKAALYTVTFDQWDKLPGADWSGVSVTDAGKAVTAQKVVYCGGAGPHMNRLTIMGDGQPGDCVWDLDTFMRQTKDGLNPDESNPKRVVLIGGNAGIDGAVKALDCGLKLYWLISGPQNSDPLWLTTKHYRLKSRPEADVIKEANDRIVNYPKSDRPTYAFKNDNKTYDVGFSKAVATRDGKETGLIKINVDYLVYATGQDPKGTEMATGKDFAARIGSAAVLAPILKQEKLTPLYDVNQRFGWYFETALGLRDSNQSHYTGLEVLGAAAFALAGAKNANTKVHDYAYQAFVAGQSKAILALDKQLQDSAPLEPALKGMQMACQGYDATTVRLYDYLTARGSIPGADDSMSAVLKKLYQQSLVTADQLGTIRHQIEAQTGFDLVAAAISAPQMVGRTEQYLKLIQALNKSLNPFDKDAAITARAEFRSFSSKIAYNGIAHSQAAEVYVGLLGPDEIKALKDDGGFDPKSFSRVLDERDRALFNAAAGTLDITSPDVQKGMLDAIPPLQRSLTNLLVVYTVPDAKLIDYNRMDRTQLAVLLAALYPSVKVTDWPEMVDFIIRSKGKYAWGYSQEQKDAITAWLKAVNKGTKAPTEFPDLDI